MPPYTDDLRIRSFTELSTPAEVLRELPCSEEMSRTVANGRRALHAILHGEDDPVVPINQAQKMYAALQGRNIPTCLVVFQGEKHGFRQSAHLRQALEAELMFYCVNLTRAPMTS